MPLLDCAFGVEDALFDGVPVFLLHVVEALAEGLFGGFGNGGAGFDGGGAGGGLAVFVLAGGPGFVLFVIGEDAVAAEAVDAEDVGGEAVEHVAIVGDEDEGAGEFFEGGFEDFEGGDVEIVGGFVEDEDVGGGEHEAGDEDAGLFAAGEFADGAVELFVAEEEAAGPGGDVDEFAVVEDGIGAGTEGVAEELAAVELLALLIEVDDAEVIGAFDGAGVGVEAAESGTGEEFEEGGFAGAVGAEDAEFHAGGEDEVEFIDEEFGGIAEGFNEGVSGEEFAGFAIGGGEFYFHGFVLAGAGAHIGEVANEGVGVLDAGFAFSTAGFGAAAEPGDFCFDLVLQALLFFFLGGEDGFAAVEEVGVVAGDAEEAVGIHAVDFDDAVGDVFEEVAVMGDDDVGELGGVEE